MDQIVKGIETWQHHYTQHKRKRLDLRAHINSIAAEANQLSVKMQAMSKEWRQLWSKHGVALKEWHELTQKIADDEKKMMTLANLLDPSSPPMPASSVVVPTAPPRYWDEKQLKLLEEMKRACKEGSSDWSRATIHDRIKVILRSEKVLTLSQEKITALTAGIFSSLLFEALGEPIPPKPFSYADLAKIMEEVNQERRMKAMKAIAPLPLSPPPPPVVEKK
jgi:hypothetical protein